jgi:hypothetical protein
MKQSHSVFNIAVTLIVVAGILALVLQYVTLTSRLQGAVVIPPPPPPCPSRSFTSCTQAPNAGVPAGCTATQYCGLGFGMTGFVCKCKNSGSAGTSSSLATISSPPSVSSASFSPPVASGPFCCQAYPAPVGPRCTPVGPGRCGAPASVTTYSASNCNGVCPAP